VKRLIMAVSIAAAVAGCDQTITIPPPVEPAPAAPEKTYDEAKFDCRLNDDVMRCDVKTGAQDKSGRWVTATILFNPDERPKYTVIADGETLHSINDRTLTTAEIKRGDTSDYVELKGERGGYGMITYHSGGGMVLEVFKPNGTKIINMSK